jgi:hypothetical protein
MTFEWILGRTRDAIGNAPREIIHLLNSVRQTEIRQTEISIQETELSCLFSRSAFKGALREVSRARLEQTLFAEYPRYKPLLQKLQGAKTRHTIPTLMNVWNVSKEAAETNANELVEIGFFKKEGSANDPQFWVPFPETLKPRLIGAAKRIAAVGAASHRGILRSGLRGQPPLISVSQLFMTERSGPAQ